MKKSALLVILWLLAGCAGAIATSTTVPAGHLPTDTFPAATEAPQATLTATQSLPVTWSGHGLTGDLLLIQYHQAGDTLIELDLQSGQISVLFQAPNQSRLMTAALSPDGEQIVLGYAPPIPGQIQLGNSDLYLLIPGSKNPPRPLLKRKDTEDSFFGPVWTPDGKAIVYSHFYKTLVNKVQTYNYTVERTDLNGKTETLISDSYWASVSPDGSKIAYVYTDPISLNVDLYIADANGRNKKALTSPGNTPPVDAHFFSQDGKTIFFSMVNTQAQSTSNWWDTLFGIETVSAHNVPSDWYKVPAAGGKIERVTNVNDTGMSGTMSPDGSRLAFISMNGLFSVKPDGSDLVKLSNETFEGSIQWIP
jgi:Tol biopolymer transport system component